ncbi:MAG TPA: hypothetical protein VFY84_09175 [Jiangellales bacterium]|nr:hypothetical protein [Jiangellales bacterium]
MRIKKTASMLGAILLAAGLVLVGAGPAQAAAPTNDTFGGAIAIDSTPFTTTVDTSEATTDADDVSANADCGAPATDASVWYSITAPTDGGYIVDVSKSSFYAGVIVVTGAPGAFELVWCGPDTVGFPATAGTTYYVLAFDDQYDGGGNGGTLVMDIDVAPPPPSVDVTVDSRAGFNPKTGVATVRGTINCTDALDGYIEVFLRQQVGRFGIQGYGLISPVCDGTDQPWSVDIYGENGSKFAGGKAASVTFALVCGVLECALDYEERMVQLSRR